MNPPMYLKGLLRAFRCIVEERGQVTGMREERDPNIEAHNRQVEETMETSTEGPEGLYKSYLD